MSDISIQTSEEITPEKLFEIYQDVKEGMIDVYPEGKVKFCIPAESCAKSAGRVELSDGRTATVIIKVTCDDDDW